MLLRILGQGIKRHWALLLCTLLFQLGQSLSQLYLPTLNAHIIDNGVARGDTAYIWRTGSLMLGLTLIQVLLAVGAIVCAARAGMAMGLELRRNMFAKVSSFSEKEVSHFTPGSLITRCTNDVQHIQMFFGMGMIALLTAPTMAVGGIVMALRQSLRLGWILTVCIPALIAISGGIIYRMVPMFRTYQKRLDAVNVVFREQLTGVRVLRAFVRENTERERFDVVNSQLKKLALRVGFLFVILMPLVTIVLNLTTIAVYWFGAKDIEAGNSQVGTLVAYMTYLMMIMGGIMQMAFIGMILPRASVSAERICAVLDTETSLKAPENPRSTMPQPGEVEFSEVTFAYPGAQSPVINCLSTTAPPGSTLALIGSTGSGKSTVVQLIPRLFDATEGSVRVGGVDVKDLAAGTLAQTIGYVPQNPYLFAGTVRSNLEFGRPGATEEEMWEALRIAQAEEFVREMPDGLDSPISQGGTNVSGGQRQRLSIARAVIHQPDIFIFDDSFSALDVATDAAVRSNLWEAFPNATKIMVAQRVSTITSADNILVLDAGCVQASGTHEQLLESSEEYRSIVDSQMGVDA